MSPWEIFPWAQPLARLPACRAQRGVRLRCPAGYDPVKVVSISSAHFIVPIGLAPGDRKQEALPLMQTILETAVLCVPQKVSSRGCFSRAKALELITGISRQVRLKASSLDAPVTSLSGRNQQKVVLTGWRAWPGSSGRSISMTPAPSTAS
tara:strand:- start:27 stop:479 length:453 start_codon:yes stop_codon:yes gene_type:complete